MGSKLVAAALTPIAKAAAARGPGLPAHNGTPSRIWAATLGAVLVRACGLEAAEEFSDGLDLIVGEV
jgi:hypothetical protein